MKKLLVVASAVGMQHYRIPARHPFDVDAEGNLKQAPLTSGISLPIGKEAEVDCFDARHEQLLRSDPHLKVIDEDGEHEKPEVDLLEAAFKKLPPELQRAVREGMEDHQAELEHALDQQSAAIAETRKQLDEAIAKQATIVKENGELRAALEQSNKERVELEAKLKAATAPAPTPPVDEKAAPKKGR